MASIDINIAESFLSRTPHLKLFKFEDIYAPLKYLPRRTEPILKSSFSYRALLARRLLSWANGSYFWNSRAFGSRIFEATYLGLMAYYFWGATVLSFFSNAICATQRKTRTIGNWQKLNLCYYRTMLHKFNTLLTKYFEFLGM